MKLRNQTASIFIATILAFFFPLSVNAASSGAAYSNLKQSGAIKETLGEHLMFSEGMWQPHQLPELESLLTALGLEISTKSLTKLTEHPMNAIVSLGGCTASFISKSGLVVTNHHCAYGSIQYNSTEESNLLKNGFLAKSFKEELPAAPGSRIYVTEEVRQVTKDINRHLNEAMTGYERYQHIEKEQKKLVKQCESEEGYRCRVYSFYGGKDYYLIKQLEIKDVRLVHAPQESIGKFGGDIDNWMWPRHTGDYAFYRAYIGKDGKPTPFSKENVPYQPNHWLKVDPTGVEDNELVMVVGYPGTTNRYRLATEVKHTFGWYYPNAQAHLANMVKVINKATKGDEEAKIKYASSVAGLSNYAKNYSGMLEGYARSDLLSRKKKLESALSEWINKEPSRAKQYGKTLELLTELIVQEQDRAERDFLVQGIYRPQLLSAASRLYRWSKEQEKPDVEREPGYQERDKAFFIQSLKRIDRRFHAKVDKALWLYYIERYMALPKEKRVAALDQFLKLEQPIEVTNKTIDAMYANTQLMDSAHRLSLIGKDATYFEKSADPFIKLAVSMYDGKMKEEKAEKERAGKLAAVRPKYMKILIDYFGEQGRPVYPDANGTLRVTYGVVKGYTPPKGTTIKTQDGTDGKGNYTSFTTLEGILEKNTGKEPFDVPSRQAELIGKKTYGDYRNKSLNSVPVNYLSTVDTTGGNSGSPTINGRGELVGLLFDGTYDSINADWDFGESTRSIHVDIRYMLWNMKYVDHADNLIQELGLQ